MKISIGNDHAGVLYKKLIVNFLEAKGIEVINHGTDTEDSVNYPDFGHKVAQDVEKNVANLGIVICGSGNGIAMTANKHQGVRCALCWNEEIAQLAKQHNNANVMSIPARYAQEQEVLAMVEAFINTPFEGGRHSGRVEKISIK